ncbi:MAG: phosphate ABC transporter substrate-binding protein PstS [Nitrospirae bacterium]|nr:phosphate ABC transporter substrate-binding protein PstS [Nitrospirota bacterium]
MKNIVRVILTIAVVLSFSAVAGAAETLNGAGASFPYPVYSAWAFDYNKVTGVRLNYQSIGSGGGIKQISARTVDFGASDAPLAPTQLNKDNLLQFPAVIGGVVPVVNIPGVKAGVLKLDSEAVCKIYLGETKHWDDKKIKSLNPGMKFTHDEITVVHRSDGSGTTAIFTNYLSSVCPEWKSKVGAGTSVNWPVGIGGKGNEGVANYTKRAASSIGYVELAYAEQNKLAYALLKNHAGTFVQPSFKSFEDAAATASFDPKKDFALWLVDAPGKDAWPISGATFILLAKEKKGSNMKVVKFYDWAFKNGDNKARELIYVPLPQSLKEKIRAYWKAAGIY